MSETFLSIINDASVSIFGGLLAASFCGLDVWRKHRVFWLGLALILIPQGPFYTLLGPHMWPLTAHVPVLILLRLLTGKWLWPMISMFSQYLFCQLRRWVALFAEALLGGGDMTRMLIEIIVTLPLLLLMLRFAAPAIRRMMEQPVKEQCQFGFIAALYYVFDYISRVYTDLLSTGAPVVVEFMPTVCGVAYLCFLAYNSAEERKRSMLRQVQDNLTLQIAQAAREISALREFQAQSGRYRHDLRHHLQYLLSCMENGRTDRAEEYIHAICAELESQRVQQYCENEAVNLILSAYAGRAERSGISLDIKGSLPAVIAVPDNDICVILSNALENALHACQPIAAEGAGCVVEVQFRFDKRTGKIFLQIKNPCRENVRFEKGVPLSKHPGHGIGTKSICAAVERHGGVCTFLLEDGRFILRVFL